LLQWLTAFRWPSRGQVSSTTTNTLNTSLPPKTQPLLLLLPLPQLLLQVTLLLMLGVMSMSD
jgi:hypothetical protein